MSAPPLRRGLRWATSRRGYEMGPFDWKPEIFRARAMYDDVQLARMEDPLPDGPWDLVIGVLSIHHLRTEQKKNLFRQVREQARSFVIGDIVKADTQVAPIDPD